MGMFILGVVVTAILYEISITNFMNKLRDRYDRH